MYSRLAVVSYRTICRNSCDEALESRVFILAADVKTNPSTETEGLTNTGVIAGIAAALVLLLVLTLVALYINYHPSVASPLYLMQVSTEYSQHHIHERIITRC